MLYEGGSQYLISLANTGKEFASVKDFGTMVFPGMNHEECQ